MRSIKRWIGLCTALMMLVSALPLSAAAEDSAQETELKNYALDCEVMSFVSGENKPATNAIDGDESTDWSTYSGTTEGSIELSLPTATVINKVTVQGGSSVLRVVKVSVDTSPDGYDWYTRRKDIKMNAGEKLEIYMEDQECEYVRVNIYDVEATSSGYSGFSICEIGLYRETGANTAPLSQAVSLTENLITRFRSMSADTVTVPEEAYTMLREAADEGRGILQNEDVSQYTLDMQVEKLAAAREQFTKMVTYSDEVFKEILEKQKERQLDPEEAYDDQNELWKSMDTSPEAEWLWEHTWINPSDEATFLTTWGDNFYKLARAYIQQSANHGNQDLLHDIEYGLDWLVKNKYNESIEIYSNGWCWTIGGPKRFILTMVALQDELDPEVIDGLCNAMRHYMGAFWNSTGSNRTDCAYVAVQIAAFQKDGEYLNKAQQCVLGDLAYVDAGTDVYSPGDGHYTDGSFLYHSGVPYNASYGKETMNTLSGILKMTVGTPFQVDDSYLNILVEWAEAYDRLAYYGAENLSVMGRGIYDVVGRAKNIAAILHNVADCVNEPDSSKIHSIAKKMWQEESTETVLTDSNWTVHRRYPSMDVTVHANDNYNFTLRTYSPRTKIFEATNGENMLGWYQGLGTMYLQTHDNTYFDDGYEETLDPYRLPGITVDTLTMTNKRWHGERMNENDFVGGAAIDDYGVEAMEISQEDTDLYGKKSWFMFDDEIVFLGSDITATSGNDIETVVDNRKIKEDNENKLVIDNEEKETTLGRVQQFVPSAEPKSAGTDVPRGQELSQGYQESLGGVGWVWLEGNETEGVGNGYIFPEKTTLHVKRESRIGSKAVTHYAADATEVERNWVTMWLNHGTNPKNAEYRYIMLPEKTQEQIREYAANPQVEIVEQSSEAHAVREKGLNILGVNSFAKNGKTVETVTVDKPASYMLKENENYFEIAVSDPTQRETGSIHVEVDIPADKILYQDERIENVVIGDKVSFDVNVKTARGQEQHIIFGKTGVFSDIPEEAFGNTYLQIGNETAVSSGKTHTITAPVNENGVSYLPIRFAAEALGGRVSWDGATHRAQIITDEHIVLLTIGSDVMMVDGEEVHLPAVPKMIDDRTMLPLRALAEILGAEVNWQDDGEIIEIVPAGGTSALKTGASNIFQNIK